MRDPRGSDRDFVSLVSLVIQVVYLKTLEMKSEGFLEYFVLGKYYRKRESLMKFDVVYQTDHESYLELEIEWEMV